MNTIQKEIFDIISNFTINSKNEINFQVCFPERFTGFNGHFEEKPVLPAICLMEIVKTGIFKTLEKKTYISELLTAKFYNVITANEKTDVNIICKDGNFDISQEQKEIIVLAKFTSAEINKKAQLKIKLSIDK